MSIRTLVILRHAKAATPEGVADPDRPLSDQGQADASAAGAWLAQSGLQPDLVLCSPALRTRQTWHAVALGLVAEGASGSADLTEPAQSAAAVTAPEVRYEPALYGASVRTLLASVRAASPQATTVLLIGHNPGLSALSAALDPEHADAEGLRTAGIAVHTFSGDWTDLTTGAAPLTAAHTARAPA
ncbi:MAG: histidine phosphatase family protein [Micromonosporaceae bacterium]|nr:histidine phosphatase family protein [Micromonosporaceae bacterium]